MTVTIAPFAYYTHARWNLARKAAQTSSRSNIVNKRFWCMHVYSVQCFASSVTVLPWLSGRMRFAECGLFQLHLGSDLWS